MPSLRKRAERAWAAAYDLGGLLPEALMRRVDPWGRWARRHVQMTRWIREFGVVRTSRVVDRRRDPTQMDTTLVRIGPMELEVSDLAGTRTYELWTGEHGLFCSESTHPRVWRLLEATVGRLEERAQRIEHERTERRSYDDGPDWGYDPLDCGD